MRKVDWHKHWDPLESKDLLSKDLLVGFPSYYKCLVLVHAFMPSILTKKGGKKKN